MEGIFFKPLLDFLILKICIFCDTLPSLVSAVTLVYAIYLKIFDFRKRQHKVMETNCVMLKTYLLVSYDNSLLLRFQKKRLTYLDLIFSNFMLKQIVDITKVSIYKHFLCIYIVGKSQCSGGLCSGCSIPFLLLFYFSRELFLLIKIQ